MTYPEPVNLEQESGNLAPGSRNFGPESSDPVLRAGDEEMMRLALAAARKAGEHDDVPIGAVIARDGIPWLWPGTGAKPTGTRRRTRS